jgi:hypothetical protein
LFLFCAILFGVLMWLIPPHQPVGVAVLGGMFFGLFMTGWIAVQRRRDRASSKVDIDGVADLDRAIRKGTVPVDPELRPAMAGLVERRRRQFAWARIFCPIVFGLFVLLGVFLVVVEGPWPYLLYVVLFAGLGVLGVVTAIMQLRRLDRMTALLGQSESAPLTFVDTGPPGQPTAVTGEAQEQNGESKLGDPTET